MLEVAPVYVEAPFDLVDMLSCRSETDGARGRLGLRAEAVLHGGQSARYIVRRAGIDPLAVEMIGHPYFDAGLVAPGLLFQPQHSTTDIVEFFQLTAGAVSRRVAYLGRMLAITQDHIATGTGVAIPFDLDRTGARVARTGGEHKQQSGNRRWA